MSAPFARLVASQADRFRKRRPPKTAEALEGRQIAQAAFAYRVSVAVHADATAKRHSAVADEILAVVRAACEPGLPESPEQEAEERVRLRDASAAVVKISMGCSSGRAGPRAAT